jgi:TolA-binding protein
MDVQRRLASLEMIHSEQCQFEDAEARCNFDRAIQLFQALLAADPARSGNDRLLYQIAKAYDLDGRVEQSGAALDRLVHEYPNSEYTIEARFRLGEMRFGQQQYSLAEQEYQAVIAAGEGSAHFDNAVYMHGWSLFKQSRYQASLASFTRVLDRTMPDSGDIEHLPRAELEMTQDTLRVMSLAFSYLDGADSIRQCYANRGARPSYSYYLYDSLARLYLEKQRYRDSAETYAAYAQLYPDSDSALEFSVLLIGVYQAGSFPSEILPAKEAFVRRYGIHSSYWAASDEAVHRQLRPHLGPKGSDCFNFDQLVSR